MAFVLLRNFRFNFHCFTRREATPTQKSAPKWQLRPFATSCAKDYEGYSLVQTQSSGAVWKSRWPSWAPVPNKPRVSVDVKQHSSNRLWVHLSEDGFKSIVLWKHTEDNIRLAGDEWFLLIQTMKHASWDTPMSGGNTGREADYFPFSQHASHQTKNLFFASIQSIYPFLFPH